VKEALLELSDTQLPPHEVDAIRGIFHEFDRAPVDPFTRVLGAHDLRTRRSGAIRHIDCHLNVCQAMTVQRSHEVCDQIEERIMRLFPRASVNIHVEPCEAELTGCSRDCLVFRRAGATE
jgi:divalent metal cation (Fe/Co/Zn/Cd) transporter